MKAIDFVVRDDAGGLQRDVIASDSKLHVIQAGAGQEISLNMRQIDLKDHQRVDNDLVITLDLRNATIDRTIPVLMVSHDPNYVLELI